MRRRWRRCCGSWRQEGRALLRAGRDGALPRGAIAAALPAVLARRDLRRIGRPRGVADRLAVTMAGLLGRVGGA